MPRADPLATLDSAALLELVVYPLLAAALACAAALVPGWLIGRRTARGERRTGGGFAMAVGYLVGHLLLEGWRPWPPRERLDWLWYLTAAAGVMSLLDGVRRCKVILCWAMRLPLWLAVAWVTLPPAVRREAPPGEQALWLAGLGVLGLAWWWALDYQGRQLPTPAAVPTLLATAAGTAAVLYYGPSYKMTLLAAVVAATLVPVALRALLAPALTVATAPLAVLLPGLWLIAQFYSDPPPPPASLALLAGAAVAGAPVCTPLTRRLKPWARGLVAFALTLALAAGAVALAARVTPEEESYYPY
jgi:hypothetical protein